MKLDDWFTGGPAASPNMITRPRVISAATIKVLPGSGITRTRSVRGEGVKRRDWFGVEVSQDAVTCFEEAGLPCCERNQIKQKLTLSSSFLSPSLQPSVRPRLDRHSNRNDNPSHYAVLLPLPRGASGSRQRAGVPGGSSFLLCVFFCPFFLLIFTRAPLSANVKNDLIWVLV